MMSYILDKIRELIQTSEKTRYAISKELGIDQAQLSRIMHGKGGLSYDALEKLINYLGFEIEIKPKGRKKGR